MPKRSSQSRATDSAVARLLAAGPQAEGDVVQGGEVREEQLPLEHQPDPPLADGQGEQVGAAEVRAALHVDEPGDGVEQRALAGAVGPDDGQDLAGLGGERGVDAVGDPQVGHEPSSRGRAHGVPSQWSRRATRTPTETSSITRLRERAASWSACRVT